MKATQLNNIIECLTHNPEILEGLLEKVRPEVKQLCPQCLVNDGQSNELLVNESNEKCTVCDYFKIKFPDYTGEDYE